MNEQQEAFAAFDTIVAALSDEKAHIDTLAAANPSIAFNDLQTAHDDLHAATLDAWQKYLVRRVWVEDAAAANRSGGGEKNPPQ